MTESPGTISPRGPRSIDPPRAEIVPLKVKRKDRCTWDETWMRVALAISCRSRCERAQYGAVIVADDNRIITTGYNGPPADFPTLTQFCSGWCKRCQLGPENPLSYSDCPAVHAEANALLHCGRDERLGGTIYVNGPPCGDCAKLIANSGLVRVVFMAEAGRDYRAPSQSINHLKVCGLEVTCVGEPV